MRLNFYALFVVLFMALPLSGQTNDCPIPENIQISEITTTSAFVEWTSEPGPISWVLEYGEPGFTPGEGTTRTSYLKDYRLTGLEPGTTYYLYIKGKCGNEESNLRIPYSFTTGGGEPENICAAAVNLNATSITNNSATIQWSSDSEPISWTIEYGEYGFTPGEGTTITSYVKNIALLTLEENTLYQVYINSNCASGVEGSLSEPLSFQTTGETYSEDIITPLNEAVDNYSLEFTNTGNADWYVTTKETYEGGEAIRSGEIGDGQTSGIETTVNGPGILSFYWKPSSENTWDYLRFFIDGRQNDQVTGSSDWIHKEIFIPEGSHTLKWEYYKDPICCVSYDDCGYVDNIFFTGPNTSNNNCSLPQELNVAQITSTSASLEWFSVSDPISYTIEYGEYGFIEAEANTRTSYLPDYQLTNLSPGTHYQVRVKANCGSGEESLWNSTDFYTDPDGSESACSNPYNITINPVSPTSVHVKWNNSGAPLNWTLEYGEDGFILGEGNELKSYTNDYIINGLDANTDYQLYVKSNCGSTEGSWINTNFSTPDYAETTCPVGYDGNALDITTTSATIEWQSDTDPISWTIEYMPMSLIRRVENDARSATSYLKNFQLTNLEPETEYYVRIQANCGSGNMGNTQVFSFKTASEPLKLPFHENFDSANRPQLPTGWKGIGYVHTYSSYNVSWPNSVRFYASRYYNNGKSILISPKFENELNSVRVSFDALITSAYENQTIHIGTMSDPSDESSFTAVSTFDLSDILEVRRFERIVTFFTNLTTDRYIAIKLEHNPIYYSNNLYIDNLSVEEIEGIPEPTLLRASRIDNQTVALTWQDNAYGIQWEVAYGPLREPADMMENRQRAFMEEAVIENLDEEQRYAFYVRNAGSAQSAWSSVATIDAAVAPPNAPSNTIGGGENTQSDDENIATAINDAEANNASKTAISIYPNPVTNNLYIKGEVLSPETVIVITDLGGKTILKSTVQEQPFDMSKLPEGIYLLKVNEEVIKIIKK